MNQERGEKSNLREQDLDIISLINAECNSAVREVFKKRLEKFRNLMLNRTVRVKSSNRFVEDGIDLVIQVSGVEQVPGFGEDGHHICVVKGIIVGREDEGTVGIGINEDTTVNIVE